MKKKSKILISLGLIFVALAIGIIGYNLFATVRAKTDSEKILRQLSEINVSTQMKQYPEYMLNPNMKMPVRNIDGVECIGILYIPSLNLELPVQSEWSLDKLLRTPCRYYGSVYLNNMVICAHNYYYHFGRFTKLSIGDEVIFIDTEKNEFKYKVSDILILDPYSVEEMKNGNSGLTLFTCTLGGRTRITVRCEDA